MAQQQTRTFRCDDCPARPEFDSAVGLAIHRGRMHPIEAQDEQAENGAAPLAEASADDVLALMFPKGVPARADALRATLAFVDAFDALREALR